MFERFKFKLCKSLGRSTDYDKANVMLNNLEKSNDNAKYLKNICRQILDIFSGLEEKAIKSISSLPNDIYGLNKLESHIKRLHNKYRLDLDANSYKKIDKEINILQQELCSLKITAVSNYITGVINRNIIDSSIRFDYEKIISLLDILLKNDKRVIEYNKDFVEKVSYCINNYDSVNYDDIIVIMDYLNNVYAIANSIDMGSYDDISSIRNSSEYRILEVLENNSKKRR